MKEILLSKGKGVALVDDEDYEAVSRYTWYLSNQGFVAAASLKADGGGRKTCHTLHLLVAKRMGLSPRIEFKNGNRQDCQRHNLMGFQRDPFRVDDKTMGIPLANGKGVALVDNEDFQETSKHLWCASTGYARCSLPKSEDGRRRAIFLHTLVGGRMGLAGKIDHINHDGFDCRRCNLRPCNKSQNGANKGANKNNKLGVKGVSRSGRKFTASIASNGVRRYLGTFDTIEEASDAYFKAAQELYGDFACR